MKGPMVISSPDEIRAALEEILPGVQKPTRYLGIERNLVRKPWDDVSVRVALAFPDAYEIGMSHQGTRILYHLVNRRERCAGRTDVRTHAGHGRGDAGPGRAAFHPRVLPRDHRLRHHRHLSPVGAQLHQHSLHARPRGNHPPRGEPQSGRTVWSSAADRAPPTPSR